MTHDRENSRKSLTTTGKAPNKKQVARILDLMFRRNAEQLLQAFFDKLLEKIQQGDTAAMQQLERIYRLSQQTPAVALQINNTQNTFVSRRSDRRFEAIVEQLERAEAIAASDARMLTGTAAAAEGEILDAED